MQKPDIDGLKADIQNVFKPKTVSNILKLRETFIIASVKPIEIWLLLW